MENFNVRLSKLQEELKAPKNMYNNFGKYSYRNAEGTERIGFGRNGRGKVLYQGYSNGT